MFKFMRRRFTLQTGNFKLVATAGFRQQCVLLLKRLLAVALASSPCKPSTVAKVALSRAAEPQSVACDSGRHVTARD